MTACITNDTILLVLFGAFKGEEIKKFKRQLEALKSEDFKKVVFDFSNVTLFPETAFEMLNDFYQYLQQSGRNMFIMNANIEMCKLIKSTLKNFPVVCASPKL